MAHRAGAHWLSTLLDRRQVRVARWVLLASVLLFRVAPLAIASGALAWGYDFAAYWLAAKHVLEGAPIYSAHQFEGSYVPQGTFLYLYPPLLAVVMTPIAAVFDDFRNAMW